MNPRDRAAAVVAELQTEYARAVDALRSALTTFIRSGAPPDPALRAERALSYPELRIVHRAAGSEPRLARSYGRLIQSGTYAVTITRPDLFADYLTEQLTLILEDFGAEVTVRRSDQEIPFPYVLGPEYAAEADVDAAAIARCFAAADLAHIGDEVSDGCWIAPPGAPRPLALFDAPRTDFSLARIAHYTGAPAEHVQAYILFTNYQRYVDEFVRWACAELGRPGGAYCGLSCAGGAVLTAPSADPGRALEGAGRRQMPGWHLMRPDRRGLSLINIGVGPSNAKTITDHLAVLRPEAWLMIGHCGGLRSSQAIGDYVLAHAYLRDDHVLDDVLPTAIPIPPLAEVQVALQKATEIVTGESGDALKARLRTGTVVTTDDRNWELRYSLSALRFNQSRAVAIDMESATIATQGFRFRTPYGTLLCVSDKPLHGEIKLPGQANAFYERAVSQHLLIGVTAMDLLREEGPRLHSRKLRSFDEPPFR